MRKRMMKMVLVGCAVLAPGCSEQGDETQEIIDNLVQAGFPVDDIMVVDGAVYVGRDAEVSLAASREMLEPGGSRQEQYRTTNTVSRSLMRICIDGSTFTGAFSTALDLAIENYNQQPLTFSMARTPSAGCTFTINAVIQPGVNGGSSGFPSGGLPYATINIGGLLSAYSTDTIEHVITHEIGHTIGFRHSDYYNRTISCGTGGNEGDAGVGAIHIPGTPTDATVGGSIMNSCFRSSETGEFTSSDLTALDALYGADPIAIAFQANTGQLWVYNGAGPFNTMLGMKAGTSPSITKLTGGSYEVAFQADTGRLWVYGPEHGFADTYLGMRAGTSPSITALPGGSYEVAFQADTGQLWVYRPEYGPANTYLGMMAGTSPSIAGLTGGSYEVAFQANTGQLWVHRPENGPYNTYLGMMAGTSPSIAGLAGGSYEVAFQANTGQLWTYSPEEIFRNRLLGMKAGTSPGIAARSDGGYDLTFQADTGSLWQVTERGAADLSLGMSAGTSPSAD